jgi:hypothetical protein
MWKSRLPAALPLIQECALLSNHSFPMGLFVTRCNVEFDSNVNDVKDLHHGQVGFADNLN